LDISLETPKNSIEFSLGCMRAFALIFLLLAVVLAVDAARDQYRGVAKASGPPSLISPSSLSAARLWTTFSAVEARDSEAFRGLIAYEWIRVALCIAAGSSLWHFGQRSRKLDPFSPNAP
jgi:hypothetical protein